jgi:thioredoxin
MKKLFTYLLLSTILASCKGQTKENVQTIDAKTFAEKLKTTNKPQLVDVRTPQEYAGGYIENATNVNWNGNDFETKVAKYDKTKPIFVYCKVGGRSGQAAKKLAEMGFTTIYNLDGGMMKWSASGLDKPSDKIIGICDQEYGELIKSDKKVIVNFYAEWCAPCKKMTPYILKMQEELKGKINLVRFDADQNKTIINYLKIDGLPVIIVYEDGKEVWRNVGYTAEEELRKHL